jgi:hypothetical protein
MAVKDAFEEDRDFSIVSHLVSRWIPPSRWPSSPIPRTPCRSGSRSRWILPMRMWIFGSKASNSV